MTIQQYATQHKRFVCRFANRLELTLFLMELRDYK
jgi:hypothetical protein